VSDLHEELDAALRAITPREAPVEAAMRHGRRLRLRRRVGTAAGVVAVTVFAAVGYPALTQNSAGSAPPVQRQQRIVVTDMPPGTGSRPGVIALGTVSGVPWEISAEKPDGKSARPQCIDVKLGRPGAATATATGAGSSSPAVVGCGLTEAAGQDPAAFTSINAFPIGSDGGVAAIGTVAPDVTYIMVTLADGQQLKLIPVSAYGERLVAYVAPLDDQAVKAAAYLGNGQYLTATPFTRQGTTSIYGLWLRPGEKAPPTASAVLTTGTPGGWSGKVIAYEGPWGICLVTNDTMTLCYPVARLTDTGVVGLTGTGPPQIVFGSAAANASRLRVTLTGGNTLEVPIVAVGDGKLWAFGLVKGQQVSSLAAYDAPGNLVWSGTLPR
jgi:hypothetical protein